MCCYCCQASTHYVSKLNVMLTKKEVLLNAFFSGNRKVPLPRCKLPYISKQAALSRSIVVLSLRVRRLLRAYLFSLGNHKRNCQYSPRLYTQASSNIAISPSAKFCFLSAKFARRVTMIFSSHTFVQHSV